MRGKFIVIEGGDGAGKDTQIDLLKRDFEGRDVVFTRKPGGTPLGKEVRRLLLDSAHPVAEETEVFLFLADRAQHMAEVVEPALERGVQVISNRSVYSLIAYQVYGRDRHDLRPIIDAAHQMIYRRAKPDLAVLLDIPPEVGLERARSRGVLNRIDKAPLEVHERIRQGFLEQFKDNPSGLVLDATVSIEQLHRVILKKLETMI